MDLDLDLPFSNGRASFRVHFRLGDREALIQETQGSRSALRALVTKARRDLLASHGVTTLVCREVKLEPGPKLTLLMPFRDRETSMFWWPELCVRESTVAGAGLGVFAARPLRAGWCIPMVGRKITVAEAQELMETDRAQYLFDAAGQYIDGREAGREAAARGRGLGMAMLVNEPPPHCRANCAFGSSTLQIRRPVAAGEELFVYYGEHYGRSYEVGQRALHLRETGDIRKRVKELWDQV
jgi:hypothetical protein